jgi:hypothetical protein
MPSSEAVLHGLPRAIISGVLAEDAPHDVGFGRTDRTAPRVVAVLDHVVTVVLAAWNAAGLHPADLPAPRLLRRARSTWSAMECRSCKSLEKRA